MESSEIGLEFTKNVYSSRDLRLAHPKWLDLWPKLRDQFGMDTGYCLEISCVYRSAQAQNDLYQLGRTKPGKIVTNCDGIKDLSNHQTFPSPAIDTWIHKAGKPIWDGKLFDQMGELALKLGLSWGGAWVGKFKDRPHIELPKIAKIEP